MSATGWLLVHTVLTLTSAQVVNLLISTLHLFSLYMGCTSCTETGHCAYKLYFALVFLVCFPDLRPWAGTGLAHCGHNATCHNSVITPDNDKDTIIRTERQIHPICERKASLRFYCSIGRKLLLHLSLGLRKLPGTSHQPVFNLSIGKVAQAEQSCKPRL